MKLLDIYTSMKSDIEYIEAELERSVYSENALLGETSLHLLKAGGKRIRPIFVLLSGQFGEYSLERLKHVAVALELIHMASLVHDDVIDDAVTRRGQLTVKSKWDNRIAMYTGDYIFAKALTVITELEHPDIHKILSKAMVQMCLGEMEQIRYFHRTDQTIRDYLLRIRRKTALLIAVSCQLGALATEAPNQVANALYKFGYNVGMAFQIRDDMLDITGTEKELGKPPGSDIRQGNVTLPFILALREDTDKERMLTEFEKLKIAGGQGDTRFLLDKVRKSKAMKEADALAARYIDKALAALNTLPSTPAKRSLIELSRFIANRSY
jgi:heptaprenyl diphosphate synthase